jgi:hypothetical protein
VSNKLPLCWHRGQWQLLILGASLAARTRSTRTSSSSAR